MGLSGKLFLIIILIVFIRRLLGIITKKDMLRHVATLEHKDPTAIQYH